MIEVRDQHPCKSVTTPSSNGDRKHKPPALSQVEVIGNGANQPHTCPEAPNKGVVLDAAREPLAPELFIALSTICLIREMAPPFKCEEHACIVEAEEVEHWNQRHREHQAIPLVGPLLEPVLELFRVPPEFSLNQQVHSTGMVPVVFKNELLPRQRNEVSKRMSDVLLPFEWRKCCTVHDIMVNIDMLDGYVDEAHEEDSIDECLKFLRKKILGCSISYHHQALHKEDQRQHTPHVPHLVCTHLGEQESEVFWHGVRQIWCWKKPTCFETTILIICLNCEHFPCIPVFGVLLVCLLRVDMNCIHGCNLMIMVMLFLQLLKVFICTIKCR
mmetsp:Transcript_63388/g.110546  ORF Transcript_63388/g.110546 Transcript_63388/m.110546 type:complete len:329 (-) Transcript_63388:159-1145(-)